MTTETLTMDDINLDISPEDELEMLEKIVEGAEEAAEAPAEEAPAEEAPAEEAEKPAEAEVVAQSDVLAELRAERERLQQQLNELSVSALADRRRLESIEHNILHPRQPEPVPEPEPAGPSPEQIVALLDQKIAQTDAALSQAELEDPSAAPALRQQLRQLERYYNNFVANQTLQQIQVPDPEAVVQRAVQETNTVNRFTSVKDNIINEFPVLDAKSEYFNADLRDQIHEIYNPMLAKGADPTEALIKATLLVTKANGVLPMSELIKQHQAAEAAKQAEAEKTKAALETNKRKTEQVQKNVAAAQATPPNIASAGVSGESHGVLDKYDFSKMSLAEFSKIPDSELEVIESTLAMYS